MTSVQRVARPGAGGGVEEAQGEEKAKEEVKPYQPLNILGRIREKGISGDSGKHEQRVSVPQPSVRPFPVARHRSEGPHWAPRREPEPETVPMPDPEFGEGGAEGLAALAKPLIRKKKPTINLSRWKAERNSKNNDLDGNEEHLGTSSLSDESNLVEKLKITSDESKIEGGQESVSRPRVAFTLPLIKNADEVTEGRSKPVDYAELSRLKSDSGASSRGEVKVTGVETARSESEEASIDEENRATIASMSTAEVAEAQAEIMSRLKPEVLEMLRRRRLKKGSKEHKEDEERADVEPAATTTGVKHESFPERKEAVKSLHASDILENHGTRIGSVDNEGKEKQTPTIQQGIAPQIDQALGWPKSWTERVEAVRLHRFDMEGHLVAIDEAPIQETSGTAPDMQQSTVRNVAERDFLRSEGDPAAMGYTLKEAADLVRSTVAGHRTFALRLITSVLENAVVGLQKQKTTSFLDPSQRTLDDVDWQAVWAYALGPEAGLTLTLRLALDDTHTTVVVSCAKALQALLSCSANNAIFELHESRWPRMKLVFTGSVFRKHTKQDEGFLGGGRWKYNIKASELYPKSSNSQEEDDEGKETVGDDATVASKDCAAGLIRMGLLPRIRYLLEVEKLKAAEDQLLDVIVALARHSPAASEAVMKCPRLVDAIIQRFILVKEDRDDGVHSAQPSRTKAIELLKVLSQASRLNCSKFFNSGAIQMAQSELYAQDHLSKPRSRLGNSACSTIIESLRLWQICIQYKMGMSSFMDIYPTLCFWLSPLTKEEILSDNNIDALSLAQESYRLLERLAQTLPRLHLSDEETLESFENDDENWAWSVAVPLVETALGWLSPERLSATVEQVSKLGQPGVSSVAGNSTLKLIETLTSVLQFLATISEKVLGSSYDGEKRGKTHTPFIPTFVPRLGLLLAGDKFVHNQNGLGTLFSSLCSIRQVMDEEKTLAATSCLHAVVRLFNNVDEVIKTAQAQSALAPASGDNTQAHKILDAGLILSSQVELQSLLSRVGDEVLTNMNLLQSFEINGRAGPAPGLGLGWGALGGGSWSRQVLVAQATARLVMYLLDIVPLQRSLSEVESDYSTSSDQFITGEVKSVNSDILWRLSCGFGIAALASPEDGELVKQVCSKLLIHPNTLSLLTRAIENTLTKLDSVVQNLGLVMESLVKVVPDKVSKMLLEHYVWTWTSRKIHKAVHNDGTRLKGILKGSKSGTRLPTVREDTGMSSHASARTSLAKEWARQRLPLPSHWILSPMATNITRLLFKSEGEDIGVSTVDVVEKSMMEETVKSGLSWLLGLEALFTGSLESKSNPLSFIPLVRKVHALSSIYVLGGDIFLQEETRAAVGVLQEIYGRQFDISSAQLESTHVTEDKVGLPIYIDQSLDFERGIDSNYPSFAESLAEQFGASSFGDLVFARQVALHLQQGVPDSVRLALWRIVADARALRLLPPLSQCCGHPLRYLYPFERNAEIVGVYVAAWTSGALDNGVAQASVSFTLCLHHIAGYLFGSSDVHDKHAIKTVARTLVRSAMRKSQQQAAFVKLLLYQPSSSPQGYKDLEARVGFLSEACEGDRALLSQVERLQRLAIPVQ
ncbi:hypothetical protein KC19_5G184600 [Ceratodon purpureus]|uniref:RNA polymerase II-associated protein 1 C-terminal domain-containing protein n=1 Tax=Ceratodon purpureus TaxID=3225 RepID=A0A8T0I465_CERPU|nr:hypothetical protein KC19_5G184600 [Ceratodon purpureus]